MLEFIIPNLEGFFLKGGRQSICRLNVQKLTINFLLFWQTMKHKCQLLVGRLLSIRKTRMKPLFNSFKTT
ncbi:MAG: hypothetical protein O4808_19705 [Trichodesmium sp. St17_bin3_1_1]|nr:hypothetical protein [Trichodesmium sp. St17_bin3_1_1]